jgi:hypothetical protein
MELEARMATNRADSARNWVSRNPDALQRPGVATTLVRMFGVSEDMALHIVAMERLRSGVPLETPLRCSESSISR